MHATPIQPSIQTAIQLVKKPLQQVKESIASIVPPDSLLLSESISYSIESGGKYLRPVLTLLCGQVLKPQTALQETMLVETAAVAEMIHVATLLHDDVLDQASLRRGKETVSSKWGSKISILSGDFLLAQASIKLAKLNNTRLVSIFAHVLADLCDGEVEQLHTSYNIETSWESYYRKSVCKTASLFAAGCESSGVIQGMPETKIQRLKRFGHYFGLAFQISDDLLDYTATEELIGKPVLEDLRNGLLTAPVLLALESENLSDSQKKLLRENIAQLFKTPDDEDCIKQIQTLIVESQSVLKTQALAEQYIHQAECSIEFAAESQEKQVLLHLLSYTAQRGC
ncbi:MAG: polyprenyl synthetase family protein [Cyanobacteria bacterium P01_H01_bin.74]